ncbi:MAG: peptidoglycan-binding protein [Gemmatimonadaceae bacterium]
MSAAQLAQAVIKTLDGEKIEVKCLFNPKEYTFAKTNSWPQDKKAAANTPVLNFGGGNPATLNMDLLFDTYQNARHGSQSKDVRTAYINDLWKMMFVDKSLAEKKKNKQGRPPKVQFSWGKAWSFEAVMTSLSVTFTLFLPDGTPVRASAKVAFQQIQDTKELPQNPTSGGTGGERVRTVEEGDRLDLIAHEEYGDTAQWRLIAEANGISHPRDLRPGIVLVIPNG